MPMFTCHYFLSVYRALGIIHVSGNKSTGQNQFFFNTTPCILSHGWILIKLYTLYRVIGFRISETMRDDEVLSFLIHNS